MRVAVDGSGNIYALGRLNNELFVIARDHAIKYSLQAP